MLIPARSDLGLLGAKGVTLNRSAGRSLLDHARHFSERGCAAADRPQLLGFGLGLTAPAS
jgi:hypothetical protein